MDVLFLAHRAPRAPDRGDRIRGYHVLRHLAARARVHVVALDEDAAPLPPELVRTLASAVVIKRDASRAHALISALASNRPVSLAAWDSAAAREAVAGVMASAPIAAAYALSGQMAPYLPAGVAAVMDWGDVDSAKFAALAGNARGPMRWLLAREARLLSAFERRMSRKVAANVFVTGAEAALFAERGGQGRILAINNGVDTAWFDPNDTISPPDAGPTIVFTGQMDYAPNVDAVRWFAGQILPRLRSRRPDVTFAIVGRAPVAAVRALAGEGVVVTGEVADPRPWLAGAAVVVAPLAIARGVQNKVLEAMAMARPVVATSAAAEGIDHAGTIRVADGADGVAAAVETLLDNPTMAAAMGRAARDRCIARFGWTASLAPLGALLDEVAGVRMAA